MGFADELNPPMLWTRLGINRQTQSEWIMDTIRSVVSLAMTIWLSLYHCTGRKCVSSNVSCMNFSKSVGMNFIVYTIIIYQFSYQFMKYGASSLDTYGRASYQHRESHFSTLNSGNAAQYFGSPVEDQSISTCGTPINLNIVVSSSADYGLYIQTNQLVAALNDEDLYQIAMGMPLLMDHMGLPKIIFTLGQSDELFANYLMEGGKPLATYIVQALSQSGEMANLPEEVGQFFIDEIIDSFHKVFNQNSIPHKSFVSPVNLTEDSERSIKLLVATPEMTHLNHQLKGKKLAEISTATSNFVQEKEATEVAQILAKSKVATAKEAVTVVDDNISRAGKELDDVVKLIEREHAT